MEEQPKLFDFYLTINKNKETINLWLSKKRFLKLMGKFRLRSMLEERCSEKVALPNVMKSRILKPRKYQQLKLFKRIH